MLTAGSVIHSFSLNASVCHCFFVSTTGGLLFLSALMQMENFRRLVDAASSGRETPAVYVLIKRENGASTVEDTEN